MHEESFQKLSNVREETKKKCWRWRGACYLTPTSKSLINETSFLCEEGRNTEANNGVQAYKQSRQSLDLCVVVQCCQNIKKNNQLLKFLPVIYTKLRQTYR